MCIEPLLLSTQEKNGCSALKYFREKHLRVCKFSLKRKVPVYISTRQSGIPATPVGQGKVSEKSVRSQGISYCSGAGSPVIS